ncbi:MAG: His/Gly/Thr/Pro-type tRNA ligase C-terminal domain-containing protein [Patescibacteria group bacterium]|nr:His/Gly/Thr/Pro-type tRNA ligase C-terminal domain-containing protein [Patescibacteria group bacterium]MCL5432179.1 His/Gly/Thr/Pro-type tRNA ligase C-terminal domain-containing protein [Patescibacteria group bacterium]
MRYSQLFPKTKRDAPKDAVAANHKLLVRGGYIDQLMAGSWTLLPLGWRVVAKITQIIREEMNATGAQEMLMPLLHPKEVWEETGRWESAAEVMYQLDNFGLAFTHEEVVLDLVRKHLESYLDLPIKIYHFSTKFRNEARATGGILRGREFLMKDLYSLHASEEDFWKYYEEVKQAYLKIFKRVGLDVIVTEAAGGVFTGNHTHEFQVAASSGEDVIYVDPKTGTGINKEIFAGEEKDYKKVQAIEVGNIFSFGTYYSEKMGVDFTDKDGTKKPVWFGSYGIGQTRLMGAIVEIFHDDKGIIWPGSVAPFKYHLVGLNGKGEDVYKKLGDDVLFDDRDVSAGEKFADADLLGCPIRLVVSDKTGDKIEAKRRDSEAIKLIDIASLLD